MAALRNIALLCGFLACMVVAQDYSEEFVCESEVPYVENDCNWCICTPGDNSLSCTKRLCPWSDVLKDCDVRTTWYEDCNKCWCVEGIGTVCTGYPCDYDEDKLDLQ